MEGVRKVRRVRVGDDIGAVSVRLPNNLPEGRKIKLVVSGSEPRSWRAVVNYRVAFRLLRGTDGTRVISGIDPAAGQRGQVIRYTIEVQRALRKRAQVFVATTARVLGNERRGWTALGARKLKRIDDPRRAHIRLLLAKPSLVDRLCARGGAYTRGIYSCWNHEFAALNLWRWRTGADGFGSIGQYRKYLINHEFGHGLGYGHVRCSRAGRKAPLMEQQSISLRGCRANGWPY
jgi:hypothetical protein